MNRTEVIEIARKAGFHVADKDQCLPEYKRFATEVERRTLERAAKVCDEAAIRLFAGKSRVNQVDRHTADVLRGKAAAIRALGEK